MATTNTYDGRQVDTYSEEWRAHCEATTCLAWSLHDRKVHLQGVEQKRGIVGRQELESLILKIWIERQVKLLLKMDCDRERIMHLTRLERATNNRMRADIEKVLQGRLSADIFKEVG